MRIRSKSGVVVGRLPYAVAADVDWFTLPLRAPFGVRVGAERPPSVPQTLTLVRRLWRCTGCGPDEMCWQVAAGDERKLVRALGIVPIMHDLYTRNP